MKIKKILFPYSDKESNLKNYWWHRLFIVVFAVLFILIPNFIFIKLNNKNLKASTNCLSFTSGYGNETYYNENKFEAITEQQMRLEDNKASYDINYYNSEQDRLQKEWDSLYSDAARRIDKCYAVSQSTLKQNIVITFFSVIFSWYLLQIIYYKILLYIAFGKRNVKQ